MRIVVVGGVAAGMSAAARARRLDEEAEIIVLDRGDHVSFANCGLPYYVGSEIKEENKLLVHTPTSLKNALNLDIRVRHEAIGLDPKAKTLKVRNEDGEFDLEYDALVLAPGAKVVYPPIPGLDSPRVSTLRTVEDALTLREEATEAKGASGPAKRAVVLGAGFIGVETAEALNRQGLDVSIVELGPHVLPPLEPELAVLVKRELIALGIKVLDHTSAVEIQHGEDFDTVVLSDGNKIEADIVVLSTGVAPATDVFEDSGLELVKGAIVVDDRGRTNLDSVWAGGDAVLSKDAITLAERAVQLAGPANRAGRQIADDIITGGKGRPLPNPIGTAIIRIGDLTAAFTGANRRELKEAGIDFHTINLHPNQHAGYFPGAKMINLVIHFGKDGRILGAQGVGEEGVDKRVDLFATAIRADLLITDLIDLDLSYSPPYGMAKDPVNLAGMVAENILDGVTAMWHSEDLGEVMETSLIVDCRTPEEYATGHIPGAINIPHTQIRAHLDEVRELADGRPVRVHCASGFRSYLAERVLRQEGFSDVANLAGGMLTLKAAIDAGMTPDVELVCGSGA